METGTKPPPRKIRRRERKDCVDVQRIASAETVGELIPEMTDIEKKENRVQYREGKGTIWTGGEGGDESSAPTIEKCLLFLNPRKKKREKGDKFLEGGGGGDIIPSLLRGSLSSGSQVEGRGGKDSKKNGEIG